MALVAVLLADRAAAEAGAARQGLYVDLAAGPGYSAGAFELEGMSNPGFEEPVQRLQFRAGLRGSVALIDVALAYAFVPALSVGVGLGVLFQPTAEQSGDLSDGSIEGFVGASASVVGLVRPAASGFEGALALGLQRLSPSASGVAYSDYDTIFSAEPMLGPRVALRAGYVGASGFGLATLGSYAVLRADETLYMPLTFAVLATLATR